MARNVNFDPRISSGVHSSNEPLRRSPLPMYDEEEHYRREMARLRPVETVTGYVPPRDTRRLLEDYKPPKLRGRRSSPDDDYITKSPRCTPQSTSLLEDKSTPSYEPLILKLTKTTLLGEYKTPRYGETLSIRKKITSANSTLLMDEIETGCVPPRKNTSALLEEYNPPRQGRRKSRSPEDNYMQSRKVSEPLLSEDNNKKSGFTKQPANQTLLENFGKGDLSKAFLTQSRGSHSQTTKLTSTSTDVFQTTSSSAALPDPVEEDEATESSSDDDEAATKKKATETARLMAKEAASTKLAEEAARTKLARAKVAEEAEKEDEEEEDEEEETESSSDEEASEGAGRIAEEMANAKSAVKAKIKAEEAAKQKAVEVAKIQAEKAARQKVAEAVRAKNEEEARKKATEAARAKAEKDEKEVAKAKAEEDVRKKVAKAAETKAKDYPRANAAETARKAAEEAQAAADAGKETIYESNLTGNAEFGKRPRKFLGGMFFKTISGFDILPIWSEKSPQKLSQTEIKVSVQPDTDKFKVLLDTQRKSAKFLEVRFKPYFVEIEGRWHGKEKAFLKKFELPEGTKAETIECNFYPTTGILQITAPLI